MESTTKKMKGPEMTVFEFRRGIKKNQRDSFQER